MTAPQNAPRNGVAAALPSTVRSAEPASVYRPPVITVMPNRNRPTPPKIEIAVDITGSLSELEVDYPLTVVRSAVPNACGIQVATSR